MPDLPPFIAPARFDDADAALQRVREIHAASVAHLSGRLQRLVAGDLPVGRVRACYPVAYESTLTRPDLFGAYYREQFELLLRNHGEPLEVGTSAQPIPLHFALAEGEHLEGRMDAALRQRLRECFDLPDLAAMDDGIANGTYLPGPGAPLPLSLFTAPRVDYSLHRLRHYTGTAPRHFQHFVLFTNYQFYIDQFVTLGRGLMADAAGAYTAFVEPGNVVTRPSRATMTARCRRVCRRCRPTTWCVRTAAA